MAVAKFYAHVFLLIKYSLLKSNVYFIKKSVTANEIRRRYPNCSESFVRRNADAGDTGLRPTKPERAQKLPLVSVGKRKETRSVGAQGRFRIRFRVFSIRPLDWDNYRLKDLQDLLCLTGLLPSDNWDVLEGSVVSEKAHSKAEERTVVEITSCH